MTSTAALRSGHSKWATIKHDKGKNDSAKTKARAAFSHDIALATKLYGPEPSQNPRLALAIDKAKKASMPKAGIDAAIARGQGISATGTALETVTVEAMLPANVAVVLEFETDNRLRTLADVRNAIKRAGGNTTPVGFLFERKGRVAFKGRDGVTADAVLDAALEAGALDVLDEEDGDAIVFTDPADTKSAAESISKALQLEIDAMDIVWDPIEDTMVPLDGNDAVANLNRFLDMLGEVTGAQGLYMNATQGRADDGAWADLMARVASL
ncbi:uncharacterized protein K452DRAFT_312464 [Aplosporella prunicola CBS 121167]|uniref:Transcriptional regulatory protein n=1 Tax=Aplosporella prunicola CBS 121167 TaxID=1176127 RepID=A0A6A6B2Q5_9PEZI|nr:uncharacterized protein K452DRAFT_312464 [Aplosporella prunicola CBS 121167]KAF2137297.1 hypothetical protein K452DRAFT_312464 [Aplosporella prunicola CBS 121167]